MPIYSFTAPDSRLGLNLSEVEAIITALGELSGVTILRFYFDESTLFFEALSSLNGAQQTAVQSAVDGLVFVDTDAIQANAQSAVQSIPGWASWTEAEVLTWISNNLNAELTAQAPKTLQAITAMARLLVALRDKTWPNL